MRTKLKLRFFCHHFSAFKPSPLSFRIWDFFGHSSFVIRHFPAFHCYITVLLLPGCTTGQTTKQSHTKVFDVRQFGAKGDGKSLDTAPIQSALDACDKAGGGIVRFKSGTYLSKPIFLHSKTTVQLDQGARLQATDERADFLNPAKEDAT